MRMGIYILLALVCLLGNDMYRRYEFVRLSGVGALEGPGRSASKKHAAALGLIIEEDLVTTRPGVPISSPALLAWSQAPPPVERATPVHIATAEHKAKLA